MHTHQARCAHEGSHLFGLADGFFCHDQLQIISLSLMLLKRICYSRAELKNAGAIYAKQVGLSTLKFSHHSRLLSFWAWKCHTELVSSNHSNHSIDIDPYGCADPTGGVLNGTLNHQSP